MKAVGWMVGAISTGLIGQGVAPDANGWIIWGCILAGAFLGLALGALIER